MIKTPLINRITRYQDFEPGITEVLLHPDDAVKYARLFATHEVTIPARFLSKTYNYSKVKGKYEAEPANVKEVSDENVDT